MSWKRVIAEIAKHYDGRVGFGGTHIEAFDYIYDNLNDSLVITPG